MKLFTKERLKELIKKPFKKCIKSIKRFFSKESRMQRRNKRILKYKDRYKRFIKFVVTFGDDTSIKKYSLEQLRDPNIFIIDDNNLLYIRQPVNTLETILLKRKIIQIYRSFFIKLRTFILQICNYLSMNFKYTFLIFLILCVCWETFKMFVNIIGDIFYSIMIWEFTLYCINILFYLLKLIYLILSSPNILYSKLKKKIKLFIDRRRYC